jgi:hypothetical protein
MATVIGDRDVLLLGSSQRALNPLDSKILLGTSAPAFKVDTNGNALPSTITVTAALIGIAGTVAFTATGATVTDNHDNTATLAYSGVTGTSCTVTASITVNGQAFSASVTLSKVTDGATGSNGSTGNQYATVYLYQWATSKPANPNGTTGYTWATGVNSTYTGTDQWQINPTNPGTSGFQLYAAAVQITAPGGTVSTVVNYSNATVMTWSQNGNNGSNGASGVQSTTVQVYRWDSSTAPAAPAGTATYIWTGVNAGTFGAAPSGWQINPGVAPSQGMTLWAARVRVTDSATNTSTGFNWTDSAIIAVGSSGSNGAAGASGASYVTAYCASTTGTTTTAPPQTTGKTSLPPNNSGGLTGTWTASVPTLSTGQYLYQSDGIYDPTTDKVTWSIPYWSSLKVGNLSAITVNTGNLNISGTISDSGGNWSIDSNGHMEAKSWTLRDSANNTILSAGGQLAVSAAAPGTLNSQQQWSDVGGRPADDQIKNNLIDLSWWQRGASIPWTQNSEYNSIAKCSPASGADLLLPGPKGSDDAVWYCKEVTGDGSAGGGWNNAPLSLDPTKTYRFAIPIRRLSGGAESYWGIDSVCDLNTTSINGNPYFTHWNGLSTDRWYLFVGYIFPAGSTGNTHSGAGIWDCHTGQKVVDGYNYNFAAGNGNIHHRAYQYYATTNAEQLFGRPMVNLVDGTEPSLREYFESGVMLNSMQQWGDVSGTGKPADNASADVVLVARGSCSVSGNTAVKSGGVTNWDSDVYSVDSFTGGAYASAVVASTVGRLMFGLNSDPTTDASYTSIDYAIYLNGTPGGDGNIYIYESASNPAAFGAYAVGDVFAVVYDGSSVKYLKNGAVFYTSTAPSASTPNQKLYFDSSFLEVGATLKNIRFGPLTSNNWADIGNRPTSYRVVSMGGNATGASLSAGFYRESTAAYLYGVGRSYNVVVIRRSDRAVINHDVFDVYGNITEAYRLRNFLNGYGPDVIVVIYTFDEPLQNHFESTLAAAMYRCGASRAVYGSPQFQYRSAYILVGIPGVGEGGGAEAYQGSVSNDTNAWCDIGLVIDPLGNFQVSTNYTPRSLQDYGYTGDYNATNGAPSGTSVGGTEAGLLASRALNGDSAYNAINDATNGLAQKLKSNAQNILSGGAGLSAGTLAWDGSGNRTSGSGVGINRNGIVAYNSSGVATFTLDGTTGNATFAGTLSAATGTFAGSLSAASGTLGTITAATIQSGSSGQRTVITQNGVNVYDSAGTLRVRMGIW